MGKKDYYDKNRDIILNKAKEYCISNKELIKDYQKEYYINNKELILERAKNKYKYLTKDEKQKMKEYQKKKKLYK